MGSVHAHQEAISIQVLILVRPVFRLVQVVRDLLLINALHVKDLSHYYQTGNVDVPMGNTPLRVIHAQLALRLALHVQDLPPGTA